MQGNDCSTSIAFVKIGLDYCTEQCSLQPCPHPPLPEFPALSGNFLEAHFPGQYGKSLRWNVPISLASEQNVHQHSRYAPCWCSMKRVLNHVGYFQLSFEEKNCGFNLPIDFHNVRSSLFGMLPTMLNICFPFISVQHAKFKPLLLQIKAQVKAYVQGLNMHHQRPSPKPFPLHFVYFLIGYLCANAAGCTLEWKSLNHYINSQTINSDSQPV